MLISRSNFSEIASKLEAPGVYSVDTETTGLRVYHADHLFSLIVGSQESTYYFNFNSYDGLTPEWILTREHLQRLKSFFSNEKSLFIFANAKFDLGMLAKEGIDVRGTIHCTEAVGRIERNDRFKYGLGVLAQLIGLEKDDSVEKYVKKNKLVTKVSIPGKSKPFEIHHYDLVPFDLIMPYGERDGAITRSVGLAQIDSLEKIQATLPASAPRIMNILDNERRLTKTLFKMERWGVQIDREYTTRALSFETDRYVSATKKFQELTGTPFSDSNKVLAEAFTKMGERYPTTALGNPSFTDEVLEGFTTPLAKVVQEHRSAHKKAGTYYANFLWHADANDVVHCNYRQGGTTTGRMSCADPNLQNLHKPDEDEPYIEGEFEVRRCFVPRRDFCFVMIDYDQMEYRLMLEYAQEMGVIGEVLSGLDVHAATAKMMGVSRAHAKTLNFLLLYGGGVGKLAKALGVSEAKAWQLRRLYFAKLPKIGKFSERVAQVAKQRGFVFNWAGRRLHCSNPNFAYAIPNHIIQGGCGDVMKIAMNRVDDFLESKKARSRLILQVHDEGVFEFHKDEFDLIAPVKKIFEEAYPHKYLPLTCGIDHSWKSWADKIEGSPLAS